MLKLLQHDVDLEDNPSGTYFEVIVLVALLAMVGIYFFVSEVHELQQSPTIQTQPRDPSPKVWFY